MMSLNGKCIPPSMNPECSPRSSVSESLAQLDIEERYDIIKELGSGTYGKVLLGECRDTQTKVALKVLPKKNTKYRDFQREFCYSYYFSPHEAIIKTYDFAFETMESYVFAQEYAPLGDLFEAITPQIGLGEEICKRVMRQIASALEFMHSKSLAHRDVKPENILCFDHNLTRIKLIDFGMTRKVGTMVRKTSGSIPYTPPEVCEAVRNERYSVETSADVWACVVLLFCTLTGNFPWEHAHRKDIYYVEFLNWQRRKTTKVPSQWRKFSPRLLKLFRKMLEPCPDKRSSIKEIHKYFSDTWVQVKEGGNAEECNNDVGYDDDDVYSHGSNTHMAELAAILNSQGIETKVNKKLRERRICEWLLST
ncbi:unnamed protein product [Owenia fusiformis]|uniref:Uncharacterized protein n=1 Tax=Owenia fusiformis TaxID=6347 RepID=A0A8J1XXW4_OWEFU|nr:unnamed protein product [Owenia fusiformis]